MDLFIEYKELYYKEIEHSDRLNGKISTALTLLTIIGAGEILLLKEVFPFKFTSIHIIFYIICAISFILFTISIYLFYKAYAGYDYNYFPIKPIYKAINDISMIVKNKEENETIDKALVDQYIQKMFKERFIEDAIHNRKQNTIKNDRHRRLNIVISITFIAVIIAFIILTITEDENNLYYIKFLN